MKKFIFELLFSLSLVFIGMIIGSMLMMPDSEPLIECAKNYNVYRCERVIEIRPILEAK